MSSDSIRRQMESVRRELSQLHSRIASEQKRESEKISRIGRVQRRITQSTSASGVQSKSREIERLNRDVEQIKRKQAGFSKQIAGKEKKKHDLEQSLFKEQAREQDAFRREQERQLDRYKSDLRQQLPRADHGAMSRGRSTENEGHDVFISHATEDKEGFVSPLAEELRKQGVRVWYDEFELNVGDSLRRSIDRGLAGSRFGIVVLSSDFFAKNWPQYELDGLVTKETSSGDKVILPIWHKVSKDEVASYSPTIADKVALNTGILSLEEIVSSLVRVIRPDLASA